MEVEHTEMEDAQRRSEWRKWDASVLKREEDRCIEETERGTKWLKPAAQEGKCCKGNWRGRRGQAQLVP